MLKAGRNGCVCYFELVAEKDAFWGRGNAMARVGRTVCSGLVLRGWIGALWVDQEHPMDERTVRALPVVNLVEG